MAQIYLEFNSFNKGQIASTENRINILIVGIGGAGHDGPDLTDSLLVLSINNQTKKAALLSVPRDIWLLSLKAKINSVYHYGQQKQVDGGLTLTKSAVSEVIGQPIHYAVVMDFATFEKTIDLIGGIDVDIDMSFTDEQYPLTGKENDNCGGDPQTKCRYETIKFEKGVTHMDGKTALKFVRSRHAQGDQGTDFSRNTRQQKVITAVKNKLLTKQFLSHPILYKQIYQLLTSSVNTDIPKDIYLPLIRLAIQVKDQPLTSFALTQPEQLDHPPVSEIYANQWVLIPKNNDPKVIWDAVKSEFNSLDK